MIFEFERTRFLADLDAMMMRDRQGAIDDMLKVLREHGVIKEAGATQVMDSRRLKYGGYRDYCKRNIAVNVGYFLLDNGALKFRERDESPSLTHLAGSVEIIVRKGG